MRRTVILISTSPVDGYPPVQHQAQLLSDAGYDVKLITTPLSLDSPIIFSYPSVTIHTVPLRKGRGFATILRTLNFIMMISRLRKHFRASILAEISYEPLAMFYSDISPFKPKYRLAHFHETLEKYETLFIEKRLGNGIKGFQKIVVADSERGKILKQQLKLSKLPLVVPNFPLRGGGIFERKISKHHKDKFEVIYCGAIGSNQKIGFIIRSITNWPASTFLTIIGNDKSESAKQLKADVIKLGFENRVFFTGWINFNEVLSRLSQAQLAISLYDPKHRIMQTSLGASNKRYQYMQAGLAQIGDMNPGVSEFLEGQDIGCSLKSFSEDELAKIIAKYVSDRKLCVEQGQRAQELHLAKYNYEHAFEPVLKWLGEVKASA